ncbi:MAG: hypothetical protein A3C58_03425 [Candidatus Staskawiczbacteria bacterium RIFCSPHIGHO2_02_FULL_34_10]|uniref:DNA polymerase III subunit delta n=2 Tax=Candidatus Staskawicziibacteriota TaxID=1817916 RepID=A0A1G2HIU3_9BACT|nr:MAG: hypothetical protein A2639_01130 [Candidatus Staskawiczbacteria bacterium RIFCSPHIGHO2_01_FULL_34_27]OGZ66360.1 MAG: hypothetical protein A3C58_03425 [Candidatus Staskawiczbacteria bacterium RIFCSPHIGHO2_02_FULL_34_10]
MEAHQKQWDFLKNKFEAQQLGHAYLFSGQEGILKKEFAKEFIKLINCLYSNYDGRQNLSIKKIPCGECQNCKMIVREVFPGLLVIRSSNSKSSLKDGVDKIEIDVTQVRDAQNFLSYKSYYGSFKSVIIEDAERMNQEAQSCFLKSLEEPKGKTIIILISSKPETILQTIFSRCQQIKFFPFKKYQLSKDQKDLLKNLLNIIDREFAEKFIFTKKVDLENGNFNKILEVLLRYFRHLMLFKIGVEIEGNDFLPMPVYFKKYSITRIKKVINLIENISRQLSSTNSSSKLALEILLMEI